MGVEFNEQTYWIERHERLRGDVRSVGNLARSVEENRGGDDSIRLKLETAATTLLADPRGRTVVDLGCGVGRLAPIFVGLGCDYTGVELSSVAVDQAREACPGARFEVGDITTWRTSRRYDLVVAAYVLVHLVETADWHAALDNIAAALENEGMLLLIDKVPDVSRLETPRHAVTRTIQEYEAALRDRGLAFVDSLKRQLEGAMGIDRARRFHVIMREG